MTGSIPKFCRPVIREAMETVMKDCSYQTSISELNKLSAGYSACAAIVIQLIDELDQVDKDREDQRLDQLAFEERQDMNREEAKDD